MNYLFINTINSAYPSFAVFNEMGRVLARRKFTDKTEGLAKSLDIFLRRERLIPKNFSAILTVSGPGSFTASRSGVILANAFEFLFGTPVLGIKDSYGGLKEAIAANFQKIKKLKRPRKAEVLYNI